MEKKIDRAVASAALAATLPAHTCVDRPHLPCDACAGDDENEKPFGWWDSFNEVLYRNEDDAKLAEAGGNKITPLFTRGRQ